MMHVGIIGLGRMGENMSRRMLKTGLFKTYGFRTSLDKLKEQADKGYISVASPSIKDLVKDVTQSGQRGVYLLVVPAQSVDSTIQELLPYLKKGDIVIDHGNSHFKETRRRGLALKPKGVDYLDCGTSGGVYGLDRGYCLMVGGEKDAVAFCKPIFETLSPALESAPRTDANSAITPAENGWLHCGPSGAGHFVKMVHNGVEYGIMQAYAEGFNLLKSANLGKSYMNKGDAEVAPMSDPENYQYDIDVPEVAELWRRGSVVGSWLLDLTADVLRHDHSLTAFEGGVSDSGEGRWTVNASVDLGVPTPVLSNALFARFDSRGKADFAKRVLNGMRFMFGGHHVRK
jgi:6-phosphogluconate dehydrogenase